MIKNCRYWSKDFGEVETPLLIEYVKNDVKGRKSGDKFSEYKKNPKKNQHTQIEALIVAIIVFSKLHLKDDKKFPIFSYFLIF
jgi:3-hydroxyacyl-CoA dehydrogenase